MRILVVDDEKTLVKGMKFNLENEGYEVECAYDGAAALELAREGRFDLIILDVMMPEMDGLEACMKIRPRARTQTSSWVLSAARMTISPSPSTFWS